MAAIIQPIRASIARPMAAGLLGQAATIRAKSSKLVHPLVHSPLHCLKNPVFSAVFSCRSLLPKLEVVDVWSVATSQPNES
jgi:hypothetical protein